VGRACKLLLYSIRAFIVYVTAGGTAKMLPNDKTVDNPSFLYAVIYFVLFRIVVTFLSSMSRRKGLTKMELLSAGGKDH
jgi:hypothetical protein